MSYQVFRESIRIPKLEIRTIQVNALFVAVDMRLRSIGKPPLTVEEFQDAIERMMRVEARQPTSHEDDLETAYVLSLAYVVWTCRDGDAAQIVDYHAGHALWARELLLGRLDRLVEFVSPGGVLDADLGSLALDEA